MLSYFHAIVLGILQGMTELFPVSSLGHSVILPSLFGWNLEQDSNDFVLFLVATHFATAVVLFLFFWKDWMRILGGLWRSVRDRHLGKGDADAKLGWLLVIGTIPAGFLGLLFEKSLKEAFAFSQIVAGVLLINGLLLLGAEAYFKRSQELTPSSDTERDGRIAHLSWKQSLVVGIFQCLALMPGFSRTGSTITGGLVAGLSHEDAARFSFLLATPIIAAAAVLKLPHLLINPTQTSTGPILVGMTFSTVSAYLTVRFLSRYFETKTLTPFGVYCVIAGILFSVVLL